jgi:hypothetical protein
MRPCVLVMIAGCIRGPAVLPPPPPPPCTPVPIEVVDEAGAPVAGAEVTARASYLLCGPSGLPEGCWAGGGETRSATTDARGIARVCPDGPHRAYAEQRVSFYGQAFEVSYSDWPVARVPDASHRVTIGPPRSAVIEVVPACTETAHVHVVARSATGVREIAGTRLPSGMRGARYTLASLGPWEYGIETSDDRRFGAHERDACPSSKGTLDPRTQHELVLDHSDASIWFRDFGGAVATITRFHEHEPILTTTLNASGIAVVSLPTYERAYCVRVEKDDRCAITTIRAGVLAVPNAVEPDLASNCGTCQP